MWCRIGSGVLMSLVAVAALGQPQVVVSIPPLHGLVAGVMGTVGSPELLLPAGASPHDFSLRPSHMRALQRADAVFWMGPALESVLVDPLADSPGRAVVLLDAPGVETLALRDGGLWAGHDHGHDDHGHDDHGHDDHGHDDHGHDDHGHDQRNIDAHAWLDPDNARAMVAHIARVLAELDSERADTYAANAVALDASIAALDADLSAEVAPLQGIPYVVFHDGYQYLERHYDLTAVGSITVSPEQQPGARRIQEIRQHLRERAAVCVFAEPQFEPALVAVLIEDTAARSGVLDPLGSELEAGEGYGVLMRRLVQGLQDCLLGTS